MGDCDDDEREALIELFDALDGDSWNGRWGNLGWGTRMPVGQWSGVKVVDGHVVELYMFRNGVCGELPTGVFPRLKELSFLDISNNELIGEVPSDLAKCSKLQQLYLSGNDFDGEMPKFGNKLRLFDFEISGRTTAGNSDGGGSDDESEQEDGDDDAQNFFNDLEADWDDEDCELDEDPDEDDDLDFGGKINHIDWD